jgi:hypothetical protein
VRRTLLALALLALGCGVQTVELAPYQGELIVQDDVSQAAVARLQSEPPGKPEPKLRLREPAEGAAIPENLAPLIFRFETDKKAMDPMMPMMMPAMMMGPGAIKAFELTLRAGARELRVYTRSDRATLPAARWHALLADQRGSQLEVQLRALQGDDRVITSRPLLLSVLAPIPAGRLAYFSDTRAGAVALRIDQSELEETNEAPYPALSPWESRAEEGRLIARSSAGALEVTRADKALALPWASALRVDYPDWAPDASALVFAATPLELPGAMKPAEPMPPSPGPQIPGLGQSALLRARWLDPDTLDAPVVLASSDKADEPIRAASHAPDGRYVVFERGKGKDDIGTLWIVPSAGGAPIALASGPDWKGEGAAPTWLPGGADGESWLAFSQHRAAGGDKLEPEQLQLWLAAIRETAEGALEVQAPVYLPQQRADESNRRLLWLAQ